MNLLHIIISALKHIKIIPFFAIVVFIIAIVYSIKAHRCPTLDMPPHIEINDKYIKEFRKCYKYYGPDMAEADKWGMTMNFTTSLCLLEAECIIGKNKDSTACYSHRLIYSMWISDKDIDDIQTPTKQDF